MHVLQINASVYDPYIMINIPANTHLSKDVAKPQMKVVKQLSHQQLLKDVAKRLFKVAQQLSIYNFQKKLLNVVLRLQNNFHFTTFKGSC